MHLSDIGKKKSYSILVGDDVWLPREKLANMLTSQFEEYKEFLYQTRDATPHEKIEAEFKKLIEIILSDKKSLKKVDVDFKLIYTNFESIRDLGIKWQIQILEY